MDARSLRFKVQLSWHNTKFYSRQHFSVSQSMKHWIVIQFKWWKIYVRVWHLFLVDYAIWLPAIYEDKHVHWDEIMGNQLCWLRRFLPFLSPSYYLCAPKVSKQKHIHKSIIDTYQLLGQNYAFHHLALLSLSQDWLLLLMSIMLLWPTIQDTKNFHFFFFYLLPEGPHNWKTSIIGIIMSYRCFNGMAYLEKVNNIFESSQQMISEFLSYTIERTNIFQFH